jgi:hypothetical protein
MKKWRMYLHRTRDAEPERQTDLECGVEHEFVVHLVRELRRGMHEAMQQRVAIGVSQPQVRAMAGCNTTKPCYFHTLAALNNLTCWNAGPRFSKALGRKNSYKMV